MTDPKNPEAQNEELDLEELKDAAGGLGNDRTYLRGPKRTVQNVGEPGPGGTSFPKTNLGGSASPGGDDV